MTVIKSIDDVSSLEDNKIIGKENIEFHNSEIQFAGKDNVLVCEKGVKLCNSKLKFFGDGCIIYLSSNVHAYYLDVTVYKDSVFYAGKDNYFNGTVHAVLSERKNIFIGCKGLFSFDIWMRTSDPHLVYDVKSKKRVNPSKSIYVGDHVWIGQSAMLLKGTRIGSGSIIGAKSVCAGKQIPSNVSIAGNPAKQIAQGVFWTEDCVHKWDEKTTKEHEMYYSDEFIFSSDRKENMTFEEVEHALGKDNLKKKLKYLQKLSENRDKNRFYIE